MANIPGMSGYVQPNVFSRVRTLQRAVSVPGGLRVLCIMGEGEKEEVLIESAKGGGEDGFDPTYITSSDGYGRYFRVSEYPMISNRTTLLLNGAELRLVEDTIDASTFSPEYDARIDPTTGKIELQGASFVDFGGQYYSASTSNTGDGYLSSLTLVDVNAPAEIWTIRCTSTLKDSYGAPIREEATFIAKGSVSGQLLDDYGQPFIWKSDGAAVSNGVISFAIFNLSPNAIFATGDRFTVEVTSKVLQSRDKLEVRYIPESFLNNVVSYSEPSKLFNDRGSPSEENTLSLGAQMAFENGATSILAIQAKPSLPRRTSEIVLPVYDTTTLVGGATGNSDPDDLIFTISSPGKPGADTVVHFFVINTDGTEEQIFPNKVSFYNPDITAAFSTYETSGVSTTLEAEFMDPSQSGTPYSYTVVSDDKIEQSGLDGYITPIGLGSTATFYSPSGVFALIDVTDSKTIDIYNTSTANEGRWEIASVVDQNTVTISRVSGSFIAETSLKWQMLLPSDSSQRVLFTEDLALAIKKGLRVTYIDEMDEDFFDANWAEALDVLETQDLQILVPLPTQTFSAIQQACRVHCERMSSTYYKRERVLLTGALDGLTVDNVTGVSLAAVEDIGLLEGIQGDDAEEILDGNIEDLTDYSVATNFGDSFRVMYFYPDEIIRTINGTRTTLPGFYIAAAAGGWFAGQANFAMPLTEKILVGFTILNNRVYKDDVLNKLGDNGIAVVQPVTGGGRVLHGKTTTQSGSPEEEEASIVFIRDRIAQVMRIRLRSFIGNPYDPTLIPSVTQKVIGLLNSFVSEGIITDYRNLSVSRDDVEPRQINVVFEVEPSYPTNWIFVDLSVGAF
jgi:hypothetical protein